MFYLSKQYFLYIVLCFNRETVETVKDLCCLFPTTKVVGWI